MTTALVTQSHPTTPPRTVASIAADVRRFKHSGAKMGRHLQSLDEMAHSTSREQAKQRRSKNKNASLKNKEPNNSDDEQPVPALPDPATIQGRMKEIVDRFVESIASIRGAEPTLALFDSVHVLAYGTKTPLSTIAQLVIQSNTKATATPYDPQLASSIVTAIRNQLQLNPNIQQHDGTIEIPLPRVSLETRQQLVGLLHQQHEQTKIQLRHVRKQALDKCKVAIKTGGIGKDEAFARQQQIESLTEQTIQRVNHIVDQKKQQILKV